MDDDPNRPDAPDPQPASRVEDFRALAEAVAGGAVTTSPEHLDGQARRQHVRQTIREDHRTRIASGAEDMAAKLDAMAASPFAFFRSTALLFYRDMAGADAWMPTVMALGDVHPANFGVMPNAHDVPIFGVNDFDEAAYAPFTWDLLRGATGFAVAAGEIGGHGRGKQRAIVRRFVRGYVDGITRFAERGHEQDHELRTDNAPPMIRELIADAQQPRAAWLAEEHLDEARRGFRADDEHVPVTGRREEFQGHLDRLVEASGIAVPDRAGDLRVKDVCIRRGAGTASLGLDRYYVLVEGPAQDGTDDLVLELKQARRSAMAGLVPPSPYGVDAAGERIAHAQAVQLVRGDVFYGSVEIDGVSFMSRERAPYRDDVDLDDLSKKGWKRYARICGEALAHAHALSDELGEIDHDVEPMIVEAIGSPELFEADVVRSAGEAAERLRRDHAAFVEDHELGAFDQVDRVYR